jgi:hypothetical protein
MFITSNVPRPVKLLLFAGIEGDYQTKEFSGEFSEENARWRPAGPGTPDFTR